MSQCHWAVYLFIYSECGSKALPQSLQQTTYCIEFAQIMMFIAPIIELDSTRVLKPPKPFESASCCGFFSLKLKLMHIYVNILTTNWPFVHFILKYLKWVSCPWSPEKHTNNEFLISLTSSLKYPGKISWNDSQSLDWKSELMNLCIRELMNPALCFESAWPRSSSVRRQVRHAVH